MMQAGDGMMTAECWADVPAGCICRQPGTPGGWTRTGPHPRCQAGHDAAGA